MCQITLEKKCQDTNFFSHMQCKPIERKRDIKSLYVHVHKLWRLAVLVSMSWHAAALSAV